ncbi:uncharacterized protein LOC129221368 [Uloborus diversus]|uniref:uncharacterized protein LOC129221368 n=1 Tax=Uloborus diversus TaxID=327109 RepID=UPI00240A66D2|nr:uncharacterized protein LOC129221368 [Uloborus diversus]
MLPPQLVLIVLGVIAVSVFPIERADGVRICGKRLADLLNFICEKHGGFHAPRLRRDGSSKLEDKKSGVEVFRTPSRRTTLDEGGETGNGVVDECCRKQCTLATLVSYCANAGSINLDEILLRSGPILSDEEYQMQKDRPAMSSDTGTVTNAIPQMPQPLALYHSSRPNLGLSTRNRPVFIVMSQLQDEEDRALGEYRF